MSDAPDGEGIISDWTISKIEDQLIQTRTGG